LQQLRAIAQAAGELIQRADDLFEFGPLFAQFLCPLGIIPDLRLLELAGYFLKTLVLIVVIKDTSSRNRCAPRDL